MRFFAGFVAALVLLAVIGFGVAVSGIYDVSASSGHSGLTHWVMHAAMRQSVQRQAADVEAPAQLIDAQAQHGFAEFNEMCVACHGAPGKERDEIGKGLMPQPPALAKIAPTWSNGELFWILKHGIKMTGMPAFGPTHSDERLWSMVAFLRRLPNLTPEQYSQLEQTVASTGHSHEGNHGHEHAPEAGHSHKEGHQHGAEPPHANGNSHSHDHVD